MTTFSLQVSIRDVQTKVSVPMYEDDCGKSIYTIKKIVKHGYFTTEINVILEPHSFEYQ